MKTWTVGLAIALSAGICLSGCDRIKGLVGHRSSSEDASQFDEDGNRLAPPEGGFTVDDSGTMRLLPPTKLQQREGMPVSTKDRSIAGAKSSRHGNSWIYDTKSKGGSFLVAAASKPGTAGGDMIRRIQLNGSIREFDYDKETPGAQGAFIYIPDNMQKAVPSKHIDSEGMYRGSICTIVPGPKQTVIAIGGDADGGTAFVLNPYEEAQAFTPLQAIKLPFTNNPCRAVYAPELKKLYVVDVARTTSQAAQEGIYVADIYNDNRASTAAYFAPKQDQRINSHSQLNFQAVELYNDALYLLSGNGRFDAEWDGVIYRVPLNKAGEPLFGELSHVRTQNPIVRSDGCPLSPSNIGALQAVEVGGKPVLLSSGTRQTIAWDISGDEIVKLDMNPKRPGKQAFSFADYGQGGPRFAVDPQGKTVYQLPNCRSNAKKVKISSENDEFAISLAPFSLSDLKPGDAVDIGYRKLLASLSSAGARHRPQFNMTLRDFAVGPKYIGVVGAAVSHNSGLGAGSDISIIDRAKNTNVSFNKPKDMRRAHELHYGFKLAKGDKRFDGYEQNSHAIIWVP